MSNKSYFELMYVDIKESEEMNHIKTIKDLLDRLHGLPDYECKLIDEALDGLAISEAEESKLLYHLEGLFSTSRLKLQNGGWSIQNYTMENAQEGYDYIKNFISRRVKK